MHRAEQIPEPWLSFLNALDAAAPDQVGLDCLGGFVITLVYGFSRPTGDLDVLEIAPKDIGLRLLELGMRGGALHKKYKIIWTGLAWRMCPKITKLGWPRFFLGLQTSSTLRA